MSEPTKKIDLIEDADASGEVAKVYDEWRAKSGRLHSRRLVLSFRARGGSPTRHFEHPVYRACVAGAKICIVRIGAPRMLQALTPPREDQGSPDTFEPPVL